MGILATIASTASDLNSRWESLQRRGAAATAAVDAADFEGDARDNARALSELRSVFSETQQFVGEIERLVGLVEDLKDAVEEVIDETQQLIEDAEGAMAERSEKRRFSGKFAAVDARAVASNTKIIAAYLRART